MKIHISLKLTQYPINIFKTGFLMRNCLTYAQQRQNLIFKKTCRRATRVPYSVMWISPLYYIHNGSMGNPVIPESEKHVLRPFYFAEFKNRYVN